MIYYTSKNTADEIKNGMLNDKNFILFLTIYPEFKNMYSGADVDFTILFSHFKLLNIPSAEVYKNCICPLATARLTMSRTHFTKRSNFDSYMLCFTYGGAGKLRYHGKTYLLNPGSLFLIDTTHEHHYYADSPNGWEYLFCHFKGGNSEFLYKNAVKKGHCFQNMFNTKIEHLLYKLKEMGEQNDENFDLKAHKALTELLIELSFQTSSSRLRDHTPDWAAKAEAYITENYNRCVTIEQLAALTNLSPSHFSHKFREYAGCSPIEMQHSIRITRACELLVNTDIPVSAIAESIGYNNSQNFLKKFKAVTGKTPSEYRHISQPNESDHTLL